MPQVLSSRDSNLFKQVVRSYEEKQYKRGLKSADQILKKNSNHGDTTAMKALILNAQGKIEEAFALGKEALRMDMKSHVCWHVYGMLYRTNKNYEEAIKAYKTALRLEPESPQIQRDLATLEVQTRDYQGYCASRFKILNARTQLRQNWTAYAIANHLAGDLQEAERILTVYEGTLKVQPSIHDLEHSEAILYKNMIIAESGDIQRALDHLEEAAKRNLDHLAVLECRADYLTRLGRKEEAIKAWRALLDRNSEHPHYYYSLFKAMDLADDAEAERKAIFAEYAEKNPRCDAARRLPLDFVTGDDFKEAAKNYLSVMLTKGVPSTFANLKHLYTDSFKRETLPAIATTYLDEHNNSEQANGDGSRGKAAALYFLAQHYDYHMSRDLDRAMEYTEKAIEVEPKNVDFHMTKARIWKHRGNLAKAAEMMDAARKLDTKDRYINSKAAKYQLRNNENEKALETMGMFTRPDSTAGPLSDLLDMQCMWFLTEDGEANARRGNLGLALKRFHSIWTIFDQWEEDQLDFHGFSLRKGLIRAYIDMVRWEDRLRDHPYYTRSALDAVRVYLQLHDRPAQANGVNGIANGEDAEAQKKAAKKAKKDAQKAEREAAEKAAKQDPNKPKPVKQGEGETAEKKDEDPLGVKLAETQEPLVEAMKFLTPMLQLTPRSIEAQIAGFDVFIRRKKYVLALGCLNAALALDPNHPRVHEQAIEFQSTMNKELSSLPAQAQEVIKSEFKALDASADLKKLNAEFRSKHQQSPAHVLGAIRVERKLGADSSACEKDIAGLLKLKDLSISDALSAVDTLKEWGSAETDGAKEVAAQRWPDATAFA